MIWVMNILALLATFIFMEFIAWSTHKFVMHGLLWSLHHDHHKKDHHSVFERNDAFFLIFAAPAITLFILGAAEGLSDVRIWIGAGITLYGIAYFLVHDIFIHQRAKWLRSTDNWYFRAIRRAHKMHHKHLGKEKGECFGRLFVPLKYFKQATSEA